MNNDNINNDKVLTKVILRNIIKKLDKVNIIDNAICVGYDKEGVKVNLKNKDMVSITPTGLLCLYAENASEYKLLECLWRTYIVKHERPITKKLFIKCLKEMYKSNENDRKKVIKMMTFNYKFFGRLTGEVKAYNKALVNIKRKLKKSYNNE